MGIINEDVLELLEQINEAVHSIYLIIWFASLVGYRPSLPYCDRSPCSSRINKTDRYVVELIPTAHTTKFIHKVTTFNLISETMRAIAFKCPNY